MARTFRISQRHPLHGFLGSENENHTIFRNVFNCLATCKQ